MSRRSLAPIVILFVTGCAESQQYSRPGVHPYLDLPVSREQPPNEEAHERDGERNATRPPAQAAEAKQQKRIRWDSDPKQRDKDPLRQECTDTREAREQDRLQAQRALDQYHADQDRVMPWFNQHCRLVEVMVTRKVGDRFESNPEPALRCDTDVGRPKGLTEQFVAEHQAAITTPETFYNRDLRELHDSCGRYDGEEQPE